MSTNYVYYDTLEEIAGNIEKLQILETRYTLLGHMKTATGYANMRKRLEKRLHEAQQALKPLTGQPYTPLDARNSDLQDPS